MLIKKWHRFHHCFKSQWKVPGYGIRFTYVC